MANTRLRNVRVDDETWDRAKAYAKSRGVPLSSMIVDFLRSIDGATRIDVPRGTLAAPPESTMAKSGEPAKVPAPRFSDRARPAKGPSDFKPQPKPGKG